MFSNLDFTDDVAFLAENLEPGPVAGNNKLRSKPVLYGDQLRQNQAPDNVIFYGAES